MLLKRHFSRVCRKNRKVTQKAGVNYLHDNSSDADGSLSHGWNARNQLASLSGARHLLTDALGSTLALTDGTGAVQTSYSYEPYGKTTVSGAASSNSFEYTGRENDSTGLYFYRARYYNPGLQRFVSEDPIGLAAGPNIYSYVGGNPLLYVDPLGLDVSVALYPGANGLGHVGIGVNSTSTTGFYPAPGSSSLSVISGQPVPGVMQPDARAPMSTITIPTTPAQDKAIQDFINSRARNPGNYNLYDRNCTTTVIDALGAGGISTPNTIYPKDLMRNLQR